MLRSRPRRSVTNRAGAGAVAAASVALLLGGCVGVPGATPTPTAARSASPSPEPIFASDEEALAAAVEAYEAYSKASAAVTSDEGLDPERIDPTVTPSYGRQLRDEFRVIRDAGLTMTGETVIENAKLAESRYDERSAYVSIYFCRDVSSVRVFNADGADVTPADRDDRTPTQAFLVSVAENPTVLVVDGVELWRGDDFC